MSPLQDFSFSSFSNVIVKSVRKSRFKLFTGGLFILTVATPEENVHRYVSCIKRN